MNVECPIVGIFHSLQDRSMRKCIVHWFTDEDGSSRWGCGKYLMSSGSRFRADSERCYHHMCPGRRARDAKLCTALHCTDIVSEPDADYCSTLCEESSTRLCKVEGCKKPVQPPKLNHCSEKCRQVDKSRAYRARKAKNVPPHD